jgi:hypothetical protein
MAEVIPELEKLGAGQICKNHDRAAGIGFPDDRGQTKGATDLGSGHLHHDHIARGQDLVRGDTAARGAEVHGARVDYVLFFGSGLDPDR